MCVCVCVQGASPAARPPGPPAVVARARWPSVFLSPAPPPSLAAAATEAWTDTASLWRHYGSSRVAGAPVESRIASWTPFIRFVRAVCARWFSRSFFFFKSLLHFYSRLFIFRFVSVRVVYFNIYLYRLFCCSHITRIFILLLVCANHVFSLNVRVRQYE